jgi:RNA polymerase sigma-70 factor (ECF subfamily)
LLAFDEAILSRVPSFLLRLRMPSADLEEVRQRVREHLLCAGPLGACRLADYAGNGSLVAFVRITAVRLALFLRRKWDEKPRELLDAETMSALAGSRDVELGLVSNQYRVEFRTALLDAFAGLSPDERNVLRLRFALSQTIEQTAAALQVSRATLVRWQAAAEKHVRIATMRLLRERLRLSSDELENMLRFVRSQLQLSLSEMLS